ncbi:unnamed protein product [Calicophoron daubneyi]|uniref:Uncharacterized protein n=1 Tax=Calicophoron daubneyi TaxID=300641 RepID=A0AAV2T2T0_CALDB
MLHLLNCFTLPVLIVTNVYRNSFRDIGIALDALVDAAEKATILRIDCSNFIRPIRRRTFTERIASELQSPVYRPKIVLFPPVFSIIMKLLVVTGKTICI